ncbi:MAG: RluA family pseudouridine synthase [Clostridia bacterium]|nr:RluA family pseudouridine synthase [Clostridia bacterium]
MQNNGLKSFLKKTLISKRIDKYILELGLDLSRTYIQVLIEDGNILVNNKKVKSSYKLNDNDILLINIPEIKKLDIEPENIPLDIIYEDDDILFVNKPKGMVVHPAHGNYEGTLVNALLAHCKNLSGINGIARPGIVHRIDKDTSGILVIAKNDKAHKSLSEQFKVHSINRIYIALVKENIKEDEGTINIPIKRSKSDRKKMGVNALGKNAITHFKVIDRYKNYTLVECKLETGRTHQIRVHMAYIGHPIVGDSTYSNGKNEFGIKGQMLHAKTLGLIHPTTKEYIEFSSELPDDFINVLNSLER